LSDSNGEWIENWIEKQRKAGASMEELDGRTFIQGRSLYKLKRNSKTGKFGLKSEHQRNLIIVIPEGEVKGG